MNFFTERVDPEIRIAVEAACRCLADLGVRLREVRLPMTDEVMATQFGIMLPEAASYHQQMLREHSDLYTDGVRQALQAGSSVLATDYLGAQRRRAVIRQQWRELFDDIDVLIAPTVPVAAMDAGKPEVMWPDGVIEGPAEAYIRFCAPANLTGLPALSVPCGFTNSRTADSVCRWWAGPSTRPPCCASAMPTNRRSTGHPGPPPLDPRERPRNRCG